MEKLPDWNCPNAACVNHTKLVFGSKANCPKCGSLPGQVNPSAPADGQLSWDQQDWLCPNTACPNAARGVFRKKTSCPLCGTAKNAKSPGDWQCPNETCVNNKHTVFNSKLSCPKCGTPRPGGGKAQTGPQWGGGAAMAAFQGGFQGGNMSALQQQAAAIMAQMMQGGGVKINWAGGAGIAQGGASPNDWLCPTPGCVNNKHMVYGKHPACPKCGAVKPANPVTAGNTAGDNPNDWHCPNAACVNHKNKVYAKHANCPKCFSANPNGAGSARGRSRSPRRFIG